MRPSTRLVQLFSFVVILTSAHAQSTNWAAVEALPQGSLISVAVQERRACALREVQAGGLTCDADSPRRGTQELFFPREAIREIRHEHSRAAKVWTAVLIAGGIGAAVGATQSSRGDKVAGALGGGVASALVFGLPGGFFIPLHGRVIYRRP